MFRRRPSLKGGEFNSGLPFAWYEERALCAVVRCEQWQERAD